MRKSLDVERPHNVVKEICIFLSDYASWLFGCGATCIRIEKNVARMAETWGVDAEMTIMPRHVHLTVWDKRHVHSYSNIKKVRKCSISFDINTRLSKLSWAVADDKKSVEEAKSALELETTVSPANPWMVLLFASLANASFCRLFGGDVMAMLIVFTDTLAGYRLKQLLLSNKTDVRVVFLCCAFFSSIIGAAGYVFNLGTSTPEIALGTSVLYLIPGIPYINSVSDLLDGHYVTAFSRFMDAALLTACLSIGLCGGLLLMEIKWF